jgi:lipopolysaccharide/colanic/teichoic acid biosynthesis glycosyltransferase
MTIQTKTLSPWQRVYRILKGILDFLISLIALILLALPMAVLAIAIKIDDPGPVFFRQKRVGRNQKTFQMMKFRSMKMDTPHDTPTHLLADPYQYITKVGKFIRRTSIDELPQFWNILLGDMSFVGTRPPTVAEYEQYDNHHKSRLSLMPGLTGLWQVSGRSNITDFEEVVRLDCSYIDNWSLWLDFKIILKTIPVVFGNRGAE